MLELSADGSFDASSSAVSATPTVTPIVAKPPISNKETSDDVTEVDGEEKEKEEEEDKTPPRKIFRSEN